MTVKDRSVYIPLFSFSTENEKWKMEYEHPFSIFHFSLKLENRFRIPFSSLC